ncbi:hypothetical protein LZ683_07815 [Comamonas testosteroni]|uniref:hypothetical protein n=1 Tax=Comamonas testosteroni TaxID=285 RepID=UPI0023AB139A|nr:hypothetical protein [Comamonas testosteroni]WEE79265.1 hypothetical protein LZ683_07815 [Comamonas testosteroni]
MDLMDDDALYNRMPPSSVSFYFQNLQRSARVSSEALAALERGLSVNSEADNLAAYRANWEALHAIASRIEPDADGVVYIRRYHMPRPD